MPPIKIFLTDVDDCLFAWHDAFVEWVGIHYPKFVPRYKMWWEIYNKFENMTPDEAEICLVHFNTSAKQAFMPSKLDAETWVNKLIAIGWRFIAITSVTDDKNVWKLRKMCLDTIFPDGCIKLHCLPLHGGKDKILKTYAGNGYYWIEDKLKNSVLGLKYDMKPLLINHPYNQNAPEGITRVNNWQDIYNILTTN
jgi:uncharacterized HAD superfamily protein